MKKIYIDLETYSSVDIKKCGSYKYMESPDFLILLIGYQIDCGEVNIIDMDAVGAQAQFDRLILLMEDTQYTLCAHNANFERNAFKRYGYDFSAIRWECTASKALYCGYPESLGKVSIALNLADKKLTTGVELIKLFALPSKSGARSCPTDYPEQWEQFKLYLKYDVLATAELDRRLSHVIIMDNEQSVYALDQQINDAGVLIDINFATHADRLSGASKLALLDSAKKRFGIKSLKSPKAIKALIQGITGVVVESLNKNTIPALLQSFADMADEGTISMTDKITLDELIDARKSANKTSTAKYASLLNCVCSDGRVRGMFRYYGASRTGRWAGRLAQLHNLPQNHLRDLDTPRALVSSGDYEIVNVVYDNITDILSQLIRTTFIAPPSMTFAVADFSAIEARVTAWLANERWRLAAFAKGVDIYVASASMMFGLPISECGKGTDYRQRGKVAELALGYGGSVNALTTMDRNKVLKEEEKPIIVDKWRKSSRKIVALWRALDTAAKEAIAGGCRVPVPIDNVVKVSFYFDTVRKVLSILLPSGRELYYPDVRAGTKQCAWGETEAIFYKGVKQTTGQWVEMDTYGGKLTENIIQAIARDLLAYAAKNVTKLGYQIVMHVHDELICEVPDVQADETLETICEAMAVVPFWARGLILNADGYLTKYYKKD